MAATADSLLLAEGRPPRPGARRRRRWLWAAVALVVVVSLGLVASTSWLVVRAGRPYVRSVEGVEPAPVALVLGASVYGRKLSPPLADRMDLAIALYRAGKVKKLVLSGDHGKSDYDEVGAMRRYALRLGVPAGDLFLDHEGFTTYESCYRARHVLGLARVIVVTSAFHLPRALFLARGVGLLAVGVAPPDRPSPRADANRTREFFARIKAFFWIYVVRPRVPYEGPPIDVMGDGTWTHG